MDLKEKILENNFVYWCPNVSIDSKDVKAAMDELSKIVAIAFAKWVDNNATQVSTGKWFSLPLQIKSNNPLSSEALFELFTQSKEYKELMNS